MKLGIVGYKGKMGKVVYDYLKSKGHSFVFLSDDDNPFSSKLLKENLDAVIDFSLPSVSYLVFKECLKRKIPVVSGTTGIKKKQKQEINRLAIENNKGSYLVSNYLMTMSKIKMFLHTIYPEYDYYFIEDVHHLSKRDSPSGTALFLLEAFPREKEVTITSKRVNIFVYKHCIDLYNDEEHLCITHEVYSKIGYAKGVEYALNHIGDFVGLKETL